MRRIETMRNGQFSFKVKCAQPYKVTGDKYGYFVAEESLVTSKENAYQTNLTLTLDEKEFIDLDGRQILNIKSIEFELNKANILEPSGS